MTNQDIKKLLEKQLLLLSEKSTRDLNCDELVRITNAMTSLALNLVSL